MSRHQSQLALPPMHLPNGARSAAMLPNQEQPSEVPAIREQLTADEADDLASQLVSDAIDAARLTNADVAFVLGISESLVRKMRSPNTRERMSHGQILKLGFHSPRFYVELTLATDARTGWLRRFAMQLQQQATALFAVAMGR
jgi:hypothetical protein